MSSKTKMQLRTNRKVKSTDFDDLGFEEKPAKSHKRPKPKIIPEKEHSLDEVRKLRYNYILQLSNFSKENEIKHSLRTQVRIYNY